jgi:hypothetical protein
MLLGTPAWPRIGVVRGGVPRGNDFVPAGEILMIDVNPRVDDGDRDTFAFGNGVSGLDVRACADPLVIDRGRLEMPLLREDGTSTQRAHQFGMAVLDVFALQQLVCDVEDSLTGSFRSSGEVRIVGIRKFPLDGQARLTQDCQTLISILSVAELDKEVLRVEHRLTGLLVDQHATSKTRGWRLVQFLPHFFHRA